MLEYTRAVLAPLCILPCTLQTTPPVCQNQYLLKYSDDSTLMTLFTQSEDHTLYQGNVDWLVEWGDKNLLIINTEDRGNHFWKTI